jgi:hypothetical protein
MAAHLLAAMINLCFSRSSCILSQNIIYICIKQSCPFAGKQYNSLIALQIDV